MKNNIDSPVEFIDDITPFFYQHSLCYVDVGAHKGKVFKLFAGSTLNISEAFLFEPNPESYAELKSNLQQVEMKKGPAAFNVAIGDTTGVVRMKKADTMTKVVSSTDIEGVAEDSTVFFDVNCHPLADFADQFTDQHISILKIDVEGFEAQVLQGAAAILQKQQADVIYIEAGLNPEGTQQTYYRIIDDLLNQYGYRLFKVYEQKHEWTEDSPFLRRMNLAYFSTAFATRHPYKLTHDLYAKSQQLLNKNVPAAAQQEPVVAQKSSPAVTKQTMDHQLEQSKRELKILQAKLAELEIKRDIDVVLAREQSDFYKKLYEEAHAELIKLRVSGKT